MSIRTLWLAFSVLLAASAARGADLQQMVLDDGSTVVGEVRSLEGGVYVLESPSLGTMRVPQHRVRRIGPRTPPAAPPAARSESAGTVPGADIRALQQQMAADPASASALVGLTELPEMQAVLSDPEILRAVERGDLNALQSNPKIQELMRTPTMQDLTGRVAPVE